MVTLVDLIPALPKVLLHDHLDGGLRPGTLIDLAAQVGHELPSTDPAQLDHWFVTASDSGSLEEYLQTFAHTIAVLQTADALRRVAREAVEDLAADGVVYTEQRWAPEQHLAGGLSLAATVAAVREGLAEGEAAAAAAGHPIIARQLLCIMRQGDSWEQIADLAIAELDPDVAGGVVGVDLAGPEDGFPPSRHLGVWRKLACANVPVTIHAGEAAGLASIAEAVHLGQALRLGHGVRIVDDCPALSSTAAGAQEQSAGAGVPTKPAGVGEPAQYAAADTSAQPGFGPLANWMRDRHLALEVAPKSNLQTRAAGAARLVDHPITALAGAGFTVTLNTDNRLMSKTSMSAEMQGLAEIGWTLPDVYAVTLAAAQHAFIHQPQREALITEVITPGYRAAAEVLNVAESNPD